LTQAIQESQSSEGPQERTALAEPAEEELWRNLFLKDQLIPKIPALGALCVRSG